ncbi:hypothetical protein OTSUT76_3626 [Orientia tsutsugamushi str. UT76]|nr:hypothetical protein OTSUT76_3626 [Orientia tsutsugamushi str. UT76]
MLLKNIFLFLQKYLLLNKNHTTDYKFKLILKINKLLFNCFNFKLMKGDKYASNSI